jgi:hypothetical protein
MAQAVAAHMTEVRVGDFHQFQAIIELSSACVLVFGRRQQEGSTGSTEALKEAPTHEVAGSLAPAMRLALWGLTRQAREVQQWTASELIDGYRFQRRQPGRTLPQLPRFGMSVAQEYF